jgi:hypothetical protein
LRSRPGQGGGSKQLNVPPPYRSNNERSHHAPGPASAQSESCRHPKQ